MRDKNTLFSLDNITLLFQYLYMNEDNRIIIDTGVTKIELRMTDNLSIMGKNLSNPESAESCRDDEMTLSNMLGIIEQLKQSPALEFPLSFGNRWEEIEFITTSNLSLNKRN